MLELERAFNKLPITAQTRFEDRVSFLYLEYRKIVQDEFGVIALSQDDTGELVKEHLQIPVGGLALLALGPGTSITNAAMTSATRYGCVVEFVTGGALSANSVIAPLTSSSKWALAQAQVVSNDAEARKVAKLFYSKQFGVTTFQGSIAQMRAIEGALMKKAYSVEAKRYKVAKFRRQTASEDNVNVALNVCNSIMYGIAAAAVGALGMNQALVVIHRGNIGAFLFDIADFYKPSIVIPIAFSLAHESTEDVPMLARKRLRSELHKKKVLRDIMITLQEAFSPYLPSTKGDRLIGLNSEAEGHANHANSKAIKALVNLSLGDEADVTDSENE